MKYLYKVCFLSTFFKLQNVNFQILLTIDSQQEVKVGKR